MNILIIYYSYGGNTRRIAERIAEELGADLVGIQTVEPYTGSYNDVVDQGQREVNSGYLPAIISPDINLDQYDTVLLGTPVWWYTFAPAMNSFLHHTDLSGKRVYPFATNGGWIGHTFQDFQTACTGAKVMPGLNIRFNEEEQRTPDAEINRWISAIKKGA